MADFKPQRIGQFLGLGDNPLYQAFNANRNAFIGGFSSMGEDPLNPWKGFGAGFQRGADVDMEQAKLAQQQEQQNATTEWLRANYPQYADLPPAQGWQAAMADLSRAQSGANQESFFGNIVPMQDESGNVVLGQASNRGNWQPLQGAQGYTPAPTTKQIDTGTEIITQDVYGNELFRTPKQNQQAAFDTATGAGLGKSNAENIAAYESMESKMPGLRNVIGELGELAKTATYTRSGQLIDAGMRELGMEPSEAAIARTRYIAIVDNQVLPLLRDTFGAAFTVQEGESLRATLGDPNKSPAEKQAVLESFIAQKERDVAAMRSRIPGQGGQTSGGLQWSIE
ncbi:hypothetical protein [Devosia sp.]|uniref:hypothetical protein n=1 Tax=Devosia sp. TaxID=1871048 RepID=UPI002AFE8FFD|nr:hypothetical protein [Devosia sp.]